MHIVGLVALETAIRYPISKNQSNIKENAIFRELVRFNSRTNRLINIKKSEKYVLCTRWNHSCRIL